MTNLYNGLSKSVAAAKTSVRLGHGLPIGAALEVDGEIVATGYNRRFVDDDPTAHAEISCLRNAGAIDFGSSSILYSTLSPCYMCAGAARVFQVSKVVIADDARNVPYADHWRAPPTFFAEAGIDVEVITLAEMMQFFRDYITLNPTHWSGDVGS